MGTILGETSNLRAHLFGEMEAPKSHFCNQQIVRLDISSRNKISKMKKNFPILSKRERDGASTVVSHWTGKRKKTQKKSCWQRKSIKFPIGFWRRCNYERFGFLCTSPKRFCDKLNKCYIISCLGGTKCEWQITLSL